MKMYSLAMGYDDQAVYVPSILRSVVAALGAVLFSLQPSAQLQGGIPVVRVADNSTAPSSVPQAAQQRTSGSRRPDRLLRSGHTRPIQALALSSDGHWLASGGDDKTIIVWNVGKQEEQWKFSGHSGQITVVAFSPDCRLLASAGINGQVKIWDLQKGAATYSLNVHARVKAAAFSADSKLWAAGVDAFKEGTTSRIEIHDTTSGNVIRTMSTPWGAVTALTMTPDGLLVASGEAGEDDVEEGSVQAWNLASGELVKSYSVIATAFSANGRFMAGIDYVKDPKRVVVSDLSTGKPIRTFPTGNPGAAFFSQDGQEIAVTDPMQAELRIWSVTTGAEIKTMPAEPLAGGLGLNVAAFSADGRRIAAAPYAGNSVKLWDVGTGRELSRFEGQALIQGLAVSPDGQWLVVSSPLGVNLWELATGKKIASLFNGPVNFLLFSRDGRWLATNPGMRFPGETLQVWDMKSRIRAADFTFGRGGTPMQAMAFVPVGLPLANLGPLSRAWEFTGDGGKHAVWSGSSPLVSSPDGKVLVTQFGLGGNLDVWDMTSGRKLTTLAAHNMSLSTVNFSHDGRLLVTTGQETPPATNLAAGDRGNEWGMKMWDVATWKPRISITFVRVGAPCAAFSPDGRQVAVEKSWEKVELLDTESGSLLGVLSATDPQPQYHQFTSKNLTFSADGTLLFQGAQDGIRVWKLTK